MLRLGVIWGDRHGDEEIYVGFFEICIFYGRAILIGIAMGSFLEIGVVFERLVADWMAAFVVNAIWGAFLGCFFELTDVFTQGLAVAVHEGEGPDLGVVVETISEDIDDLIKELWVSEHPQDQVRFKNFNWEDIFSLSFHIISVWLLPWSANWNGLSFPQLSFNIAIKCPCQDHILCEYGGKTKKIIIMIIKQINSKHASD